VLTGCSSSKWLTATYRSTFTDPLASPCEEYLEDEIWRILSEEFV